MRIGLIAPPWVEVPPRAYGGTEAVVDNLARGLTALGHEVVLFTVGSSTSPVERQYLFDEPPSQMNTSAAEAAHSLAAYKALAGQVDIIHDHTALGALIAGRNGLSRTPVVVTNHTVYSDLTRPILSEVVACGVPLLAISHDQASRAQLPIAAVIHHGIDLETYTPGEGRGDYLAFIGRMSPEKGVTEAVRIAHGADRELRIVCKIRAKDEWDYYETEVRPLLGTDERPHELPLNERLAVMRDAVGIVNPIGWDEPFGLVMAESLATAAPVVAFPRGAAPEIIRHEHTGFLCQDVAAGVAAVGRIGTIDRAECRRDAEERFSVDRMARQHAAVYEAVIDGRPIPADCRPVPVDAGAQTHPSPHPLRTRDRTEEQRTDRSPDRSGDATRSQVGSGRQRASERTA